MSASAIPIPVISLQEHDNHPSLGSAIFAACTTSGFFYLSDHGLDPNLVDAVFEASRAFFLEDGEGVEEVKRAYADRESNTGYTPMKQESLDPTNPASSGGDLKESFYLSRLLPNISLDTTHPAPAQLLPPTLETRRAILGELVDECRKLCAKVLQGFAVALQLPETHFTTQHHGAHDRLRLIHYPPVPSSSSCPSSHPQSQPQPHTQSSSIRAGAHSDYGSFTLLFQREVGGLQVRMDDRDDSDGGEGRWVDIPAREGCLVVNVGDALEFWTAGLFRSTLHRVVLPPTSSQPQSQSQSSGSRFSMAYFCQPDEDALLEPLAFQHLQSQSQSHPHSQSDLNSHPNSHSHTHKHEPAQAQAQKEAFEKLLANKGIRGGTTTTLTGGQHLRARLAATYGA